MPSSILPDNIIEISTWYCNVCMKHLDDPVCPKCNGNMIKTIPPLGVNVSDTAGVTSKIG